MPCALSAISLGDAFTPIPRSQVRDRPAYEALSYVWGDTSVTSAIFLEGNNFQVTTSLESALRSLRHYDQQRVLWIDAICIKQADVEERNQHVLLMGEIYTEAQQVVVWHSLEDELIDNAIGFILDIGSAGHLASHYGSVLQSDNAQKILRPLTKYINCEWFYRTWIVQEVAHARTVLIHCGKRHIAWDDLTRFTMWLCEHIDRCVRWVPAPAKLILDTFRGRTEKLHIVRSYVTKNGSNVNLCSLSEMMRDQRCTDDRDRVYSFFGLMRPILRPKYQLSVTDLYRQTIFAHIQDSGTLDILLKAGPRRKLEDLPSWVPGWTTHNGWMSHHPAAHFTSVRQFALD